MDAVMDARCATLEHGDADGARLIDTERAFRLLKARLQADQHSANLLMEQIGECEGCIGGLFTYLLAYCSDLILEVEGSQERAAHRVEQELAQVVNEMRSRR